MASISHTSGITRGCCAIWLEVSCVRADIRDGKDFW